MLKYEEPLVCFCCLCCPEWPVRQQFCLSTKFVDPVHTSFIWKFDAGLLHWFITSKSDMEWRTGSYESFVFSFNLLYIFVRDLFTNSKDVCLTLCFYWKFKFVFFCAEDKAENCASWKLQCLVLAVAFPCLSNRVNKFFT